MNGRIIGRYALFEPIASGGMATVHLGKLLGPVGFSRTVAIKRLHENLARNPTFVAMLVDEARLVSRIDHPNVVPTLDVVTEDDELFLVMEYVNGDSLASLMAAAAERGDRIPVGVAVSLVVDVLHGLHAAHEAKSERGEPLDIVHRDVSPHNVLVGVDGAARVADFGVAKAIGRVQSTRDGQIKGKLAYMAPEQALAREVDARTDVFAAGVVLWELLAGRYLFARDAEAATLSAVLTDPIEPPSVHVPELAEGLDAIVLRAVERDPEARFASALDFALALEDALSLPRAHEVGDWVAPLLAPATSQRAHRIAAIDASAIMAAAAREAGSPTGAKTGAPAPVPRLHAATLPASSATSSDPATRDVDAIAPPSRARARLAAAMTFAAVFAVAVFATVFVVRARSGDAALPASTASTAAVASPSPSSSPSAGDAARAASASSLASDPASTPSSPAMSLDASTPMDTATALDAAAADIGTARDRSRATPRPGRDPRAAAQPVRATTPPSPSPSGAAPAGPRCDPPYTFDRDGVRVPKRECLGAR